MKYYLKLSAVTLLSSIAILFGTLAQADEVDPQIIVFGLQGDPYFDLAPACVAIQLGMLLLNENAPPTDIKAEVTLFASVDGVGIADAHALNKSKTICDTMSPATGELGTAFLADLVQDYLDAGGNILACPMCWAVYQDSSEHKNAYLIPQCDVGVTGICFEGVSQVESKNPKGLILSADKFLDY
mgnify:FL=1